MAPRTKTPMSESDRFQFDTATEIIESILRQSPSYMRLYVAPWVRKIETECRLRENIFTLAGMGNWSAFNQSVLLELATEQSEPFIKLCIQLCKRGITHSPASLVMWWRRMIASGQTNTLTYFTWITFKWTGQVVTGQDILFNCTNSKAMFESILVAVESEDVVDHHLRELLGGLGSKADIHKAWKTFAMTHHPDKGGDPQKFLEVKVVYDEWCKLHNNLNNNKEG